MQPLDREQVHALFLDDVKCNGLEYRLMDCVHSGIEVTSCTHDKDASVVCVEGM